MKNLILGLLLLAGGAAQAVSPVPAKDLQDQRYLIQRLDDASLKAYLGKNLRSATTAVGLFTPSDSDYSSGVPGTYNVQDAVTGEKLVIPAGTVVTDVKVYTPTTLLTGATVEIGYSGSVGALLTARGTSSMTTGTVVAGVPVGTAATAIARTSDTDVTMTITGVTITSGKSYILIDMVPGLD